LRTHLNTQHNYSFKESGHKSFAKRIIVYKECLIKNIKMNRSKLVSTVNFRLRLEDMEKLRNQADELQLPVSSYIRMKLTKELKTTV